MADPKDAPKNESFLRKVARFVAHPTTDWTDLNTIQRESTEADAAKSELKAMIERKRRNDFVRKREFDMLRKIRREGLTGERLASLEGLSHLDDSEVRSVDSGSRADMGVKAKIDAIEQQMVGDTARPAGRQEAARRSSAVMRSTAPAPLSDSRFGATTAPQIMRSAPVPADLFHPTHPQPLPQEELGLELLSGDHISTTSAPATLTPATPAAAPIKQKVSAMSPLHQLGSDNEHAYAVEVTELAHDPDLDEAVIAFANADFDQCERMLTHLISSNGGRAQHADTWFALFDLYRAVGQQPKFEALAVEYAQRFGWSAPQWFSMPKLVAEAAAAAAGERQRHSTKPSATNGHASNTIGWVAPALVDEDSVTELRSQLLQLPLPWVLDWRATRSIDAQACTALAQLLHDWAQEPIEMRWIGGEGFFNLLADEAPTGTKDADPAIWLLRLEALRLANQPVEFDQIAIDYCLTYEVSPPSWTPAKCTLRLSSGSGLTVAPITQIAEVSTSFLESQTDDDSHHIAHVELSGQLVGDISELLRSLDGQMGAASMVHVSCARLIRMDFIAAGDLLNWVLAKRGENRAIKFVDAHRLVALFCGAMGISEHARVTVRTT
jgi:hypothetical protein